MNVRGSGVLLHITSLPSRFGIGDLGPAAYDFAGFLARSGQRYWQILPVHPTDPAYDNSPYHALSAFAFNTLLISPEQMVIDGYLDRSEIEDYPSFPTGNTDFTAVTEYKEHLFAIAYRRFKAEVPGDFIRFCVGNAWWLDDYALFTVIRKRCSPLVWGDWPHALKYRHHDAIEQLRNEEADEIQKVKFLQFIFQTQWESLHRFCREKGVMFIGDIPIYVDYDSADLWINPSLFRLDMDGKPAVIAGVPPDYFSSTGQIWNSPIYDWEEMERTGFSWWIARIEHLISLVDYVRIDHFRGLCGYWEIPAGSKTAVSGQWAVAPGFRLLKALARRWPYLPVIAEDLGVITPDVREALYLFSIPGMKVLQFAFGEGMAESPYIPHNIPKKSLVYTATHDNNPTTGWFTTDATGEEKENLSAYLGREVRAETVSSDMIRLAMMSRADTAILLMQDILGLDSAARMNTPGTDAGNWCWRMLSSHLTREVSAGLRRMTEVYGRV